ncbi:histidine kinase [Aeromicrobium duanguangcaii]|uniref:histidine kinase n=1 Tax=Aeromicrobium duanguangcaii TaxID=2968086 RepID=A0ABY5KLU1_9ACTN|nr:histidine kinase [Aeromicrobium duanguangcaii]UUI70056.1 histidine kinase [Aeromicrobium duanguangcaii]
MPAPPISRWGHTWRIALVLGISGLAWGPLAEYQWDRARWWFWLDLAVGVLSFVAIFWRRRFPVAVALTTNIAAGFFLSAGGPATISLFSLSTRRRWREILPVSAAGFASGAAFILFADPTAPSRDFILVDLALLTTIVAITVGWGMYAGSRRELLATLRDRAETAESEQAARIAQARIAERAQIAREMHDVLAHRISIVTMHAGALSYRDDLSADEVKATAATIEQSSRLALVELREVLGVLREGAGDAEPEPPQPTAAAIADLVQRFRDAGMNLVVDVSVDPASIPAPIGRTAYRVVQEGLTNAAKHAPRTRVELTMSGGPETGLTIEVTNRIPAGQRTTASPPESGLGLIGLTERAQLAGGGLHRSTTTDRHVLRVWLPWAA